MSRASRVPYHQNVYDLLQIEPRALTDASQAIREWESTTGNSFPRAMAEWYTADAEMRYGENFQQIWNVSLVQLWSEFSNAEQAFSLADLFGSHNRPEHLWSEPDGYDETAYPCPFFRLIFENQGNWCLFAYADGSEDPPVFATEGEYGPWLYSRPDLNLGHGWQTVGSFTSLLMSWFAEYYIEASFVPRSFNSTGVISRREGPAPPKPYLNGLWLRVPDEPFAPPVIDFLTEQLGEPERVARPGNVTTYTFRPAGGTIRVTADEPALTGALSAWWVHADTPERLAEFARLLSPWGTLRDTLRADTDAARAVLQSLRG